VNQWQLAEYERINIIIDELVRFSALAR